MAEPKIARILDDFADALLLINGASPYFYEIGENQIIRAEAAIVEPTNGPFPMLIMAETAGEITTSASAGNSDRTTEELFVTVSGFLGDRSDVRRNLHRLVSDIRTAAWQDPYRSDMATVTWPLGFQMFWPTLQESKPRVDVHFRIDYQLNLSDLTDTVT